MYALSFPTAINPLYGRTIEFHALSSDPKSSVHDPLPVLSGVKVHKLSEGREGSVIKLGAVPVSPETKLPVLGLHQREPPSRSGTPEGFDVEWMTTDELT